MPPKRDTAYADDVSADEEAALDELMRSNQEPEPDDQPGASTDDNGGDDDGQKQQEPAKQPEPKQPDPAPATTDDDAPGGQTDDERLAAFLEKHKDKSPEELARLAFQQNQRASRAEFDGRKAAANLQETLKRISDARDARVREVEERRKAFKDKLERDPDAALLEARSEQLTAEERAAIEEAEAAEFEARADAAVEFASAVIPDFANRAPAIRAFGTELGFTPQEISQVVDGRQIVTLHLASIAGNMIKAGLIDPSGQFLQLPEPVKDLEEQQGQRQERRPGFGRQPARGAGNQPSLEQQLTDVLNMTDEELDKLDPAVLDAMLRAADGQV